ncbi:CLUMA_CG014592, isoform A [Clunio marinus]|uniref:CLUMA_CG014592, isoform A n=1 Tax=Clunio marinus TaxID=568069 RepID=A0A1J1IMQ7_9DIPT|nr:CLUMA_CG014592, isoform A [Clunio marinus]
MEAKKDNILQSMNLMNKNQGKRKLKDVNSNNMTYGEYHRNKVLAIEKNENVNEDNDEQYEVESVHFVSPQDKLEKVMNGTVWI